MCVHCVRACASVRICPSHNSYIYTWISKFCDTVVVLEVEKCHLKHFLGRLNVKVTLEGHINELFWAITPIHMHGFQNNFAQVVLLEESKCHLNNLSCTYTYHPHHPFTPHPHPHPHPPPKKKKKKKKRFFVRLGFFVNL